MGKESFNNEKHQQGTKHFKKASGIPVKGIYVPKDVEHIDYLRELGDAGQYPYHKREI